MLDGIVRVDDTPVHKAMREALVNCLVNADFFLPRGVVIRKDANQVVFENPGSIRTGKEQMLRGGISDPRNKTLLKMFNLIGIGERAGSGVPDIYAVWEQEGWRAPEIEEQYGPDRTVLTLSLEKEGANPQVTPQVSPQAALSEKIVNYCSQPRSKKEITEYCGYKDSKSFGARYIQPLLVAGRLSMTIPYKPNSHLQKYIAIKD